MEAASMQLIELELKYCERCGGLWLRPRGCAQVYCPPCGPKMREFAISRKTTRPVVPGGRALPSRCEVLGSAHCTGVTP